MSNRSRNRAVLALAVLAISVWGCGDILGERGSGDVITETRDVTGFSEIDLAGEGRVEVQFGNSESLVIEAEDNLMPLLTSEVSGGVLTLGTTENVDPTEDIVYTVTVTDLSRLRLGGSGEILVPDLEGGDITVEIGGSGSVFLTAIDVDGVGAEVSGSGNIELSGIAEQLTASISGSGRLNAEALSVNQADVDISGSGDVVVNATDSLVADVSGSGSIEYLGDPTVTSDISGSGSIEPRE